MQFGRGGSLFCCLSWVKGEECAVLTDKEERGMRFFPSFLCSWGAGGGGVMGCGRGEGYI
ncbi:hypothetical protein HQ36_05530 [Porphyromonas gingivicanis]|uniref:Uncharacterized protein n=1 Tax=Porphyromonas gingivicanis TaxID=266762 RepID=A0A0A2G385_9PORP|nr:hypothetical protein HQ36_05530 [Porphyromonas gingivicanis]